MRSESTTTGESAAARPRQAALGRRPGAHRGGFTLIEMLTVMVIIGILATFALPRINSRGMHADAAVRLVRGTLEVAQRTAVARQYDVIVGFDVPNNTIRVIEDRNNNGVQDSGERSYGRSLEGGAVFAAGTSSLPGAPPGAGPVVLDRSRTIGGLPSVIFRRNGAASSSAAIFLGGPSDAPEMVRGITIEQATGRPEAFRRVGSAWRRTGP